MEIDIGKFSDILREYVAEKQKINPILSEAQIAHKIGIHPSTFNRMMNRYIPPSLKNIATLCEFIPKMRKFVKNNVADVNSESETSEYVGDELEDLLADEHLFITYALAISFRGVTENEILYCIGHAGQKALQTLVDKGFVKKAEDNRYRATNVNKGIVLSFEVLKKHILVLAEKYKPDNCGNNYMYYKTETLNKAGFKELQKIYKEAHRKVQRLMEKEEYQGNIPTFAVGFCDMFFTEQQNKGKGKAE